LLLAQPQTVKRLIVPLQLKKLLVQLWAKKKLPLRSRQRNRLRARP
jgi:hypothetical protein